MALINEKFKLKNVELSSRLVMPPMATSKSVDGEVNQDLCDYYNEKSAGNYIGLIITEHSYISPEGKATMGKSLLQKIAILKDLKN